MLTAVMVQTWGYLKGHFEPRRFGPRVLPVQRFEELKQLMDMALAVVCLTLSMTRVEALDKLR